MAKAKKQSRIVLTEKGLELQFNFGSGWKTEMIVMFKDDGDDADAAITRLGAVKHLLESVNHHMYLGCEYIGFTDEREVGE